MKRLNHARTSILHALRPEHVAMHPASHIAWLANYSRSTVNRHLNALLEDGLVDYREMGSMGVGGNAIRYWYRKTCECCGQCLEDK